MNTLRNDALDKRVAQLQEICKRRNELLREMFFLLQKREDIGSISVAEDEEEQNQDLQAFLEEFDLEKHPDTAFISSYTDDQLLGLSLPQLGQTTVETNLAHSSSNSPMSDPPASPSFALKTEPSKLPSPQKSPVREIAHSRHYVDEDPESDDVLRLESSSSQKGIVRHQKTTYRKRSHVSDDEDRDELDIIGSGSPSPATRPRLLPPSRQSTVGRDLRSTSVASQVASERKSSPRRSTRSSRQPSSPPAHTPAFRTSKSPTLRSASLKPTSPSPLAQSPTTSVRQLSPIEQSSSPDRTSPLQHSLPSPVAQTSGTSVEAVESIQEPPARKILDEDLTDDESMVETEPQPSSSQNAISLLEASSEETVKRVLRSSPDLSEPLTVQEPLHPQEYFIAAPQPRPLELSFVFDDALHDEAMMIDQAPPSTQSSNSTLEYTLPPLSILPAEFQRREKPSRQQRKREKERDKNGADKVEPKKEEWSPMGMIRWGAVVRANPLWKKVSRATKYLSTHDWSVAMTELRLVRTLDRIDAVKNEGRWSFRQPKKQRGVGGLYKTHGDYLMDEMRWMRLDFREERRWKIALSFALSRAVMDWHKAGSLEERVRRGICVLWKRPKPEDIDNSQSETRTDDMSLDIPDDGGDSRESPTPLNDYGSDEDSDDEQEKERQDVLDVLEPNAVINDALQPPSEPTVAEDELSTQKTQHIEPKIEDVDDPAALRTTDTDNVMDVDAPQADQDSVEKTAVKADDDNVQDAGFGLKTNSTDPLLGNHVLFGCPPPPSKPKLKPSVYGPLQEQVLYSDLDKLFLNFDDLDLNKGMSNLSVDDTAFTAPPPAFDLADIFADLQPFSMPDVSPITPSTAAEGKKKSDRKGDKDDPNKRIEETTYSKLSQTSVWMQCKPTLISALSPSRYWHNGYWSTIEEPAVAPDLDSPPTKISEENACALFDGSGTRSSTFVGSMPPPPKDARRRAQELVWMPGDDNILKSIVEKYNNNWALVADAFNSSRITIRTDKRSAWDCYDRWNSRFGGGRGWDGAAADEARPQTPSTPVHMTTRGHKRSISSNLGPNAYNGGASGSKAESRKRLRHSLMQEFIRKSIKKKEAALKNSTANQRKPAVVHDTHGKYNQMPRLTPAELSRMKAEKETQELMQRRRNDELLTRQQHLLREQAQRAAAGAPPNMPQPQQQQTPNGVPRTPGSAIPAGQVVPQIRAQVGISQQQRMANPIALGGTRLSPTQFVQAQQQINQARLQVQQAQAAQAQAHAQAQAQAQVHAQTQAQAAAAAHAQAQQAAVNGAAMNGAHLSPPYAARAATSSPANPHQSPPLASPTPSNAASLSRPSSAQPHSAIAPPTVNAIPRPNPNMAPYYVTAGGSYTPEQMEQAMRYMRQQQAHVQQAQAAAAAAAASGSQNPQNGSYSQS